MAFGGKNRVRVQAQVEGVTQSKGELDKFRKAFDDLGKSKGVGLIAQGVGMGAGLGAWNALSAGISGAVDVAVDAIGKASDLRESMTLTEQVFGKNTAAVEQWASATDDAFSKREALDYLSQFGNLLQGAGVGLDEATKKSEELTKLAGDLGSAFNTSSQEAADAIKSALVGESEPIRRFGVILSEAAVKAEALATGIHKGGGELTDSEKALARYQLILKGTTRVQGTFGKDTSSLADAQKSLQTNVEDLEATLAEKAIPTLAEWTNELADAAVEAGKQGGILDELGKAWGDLNNAVITSSDTTYQAQTQFGELGQSLNDFADDFADFITPWDTFVAKKDERAGALEDLQKHLDAVATQSAPEFTSSSREMGRAIKGVEKPASTTAGNLSDLADQASTTADKFDDLRSAVRKAMDQMVEDKYDPEQLALKLQSTKLELKQNIAKLHDLEAIKHPTLDQRKDIVDTKLAISEGKEEVEKLTGQIRTLNGQSVARITAHFNALGKKIDWTSQQAADLLTLLRNIDNAESNVNWRGANDSGGKGGKATGGFVPVGWEGPVGEEGPERAHVVPGGVIFTSRDQSQSERAVMPVAAAAAWSGGSAGTASRIPVEIPITLDGREIARVVDEHLYYEAARAPQSTFGG